MKKLFLLLLIIAGSLLSYNGKAQGENNIWAFGDGVGLDFNSGTPTVITTAIVTNEGCASICDPAGNLLFYSNGQKVWDKTHTVMPNGSAILGSPTLSSTMGVAIVALTTVPDMYFLFTLGGAAEPGFGNLYYSLIDMSLNSGRGDIVSGKKNILIANGMSEKMIVGAGCGSIWLLTHSIDSPVFYAFKITGTTIPPPIKTEAGATVKGGNYIFGEMKFSADYSKIALGNVGGASTFNSRIEIFDFEKVNGEIRAYNPIDSINTYSIEFSPDGSKLYVSCTDSGFAVYQYDLSHLPDAAAVAATKVKIANGHNSIRRATNGKIYMQSGATEMSIIKKPNLAGTSCDLEWRSPTITGLSKSGLGNLGNSTAKALVKEIIMTSNWDTSICELKTYTYASKRGSNFFKWNDGDTSRERTFLSSGKYWISSYQDCIIYIDTVTINYTPVDNIFESSTDTIICGSSTYNYISKTLYSNYKWNDGDTSRNRSFNSDGKFWLRSEKDCDLFVDTLNLKFLPAVNLINTIDSSFCFAKEWIIKPSNIFGNIIWSDGSKEPVNRFVESGIKWALSRDSFCNTYIDTFKARFVDFSFSINDTEICKNEIITLDATVNDSATYLWQDNSTNNRFAAKQSGNYWVEVSVGKCKKREEIKITDRHFDVDFGENKTLCEGDTIVLNSNISNANYFWQDSSTNQNYTVSSSGTYSVKITSGVCFTEDSIYIDFTRCNNCIAIPNAFTPDKNGRNDFFRPLLECPTLNYALKIYNRYGQEVFASTNPLDKWDGTFSGKELELGAYYYFLKVQFDYPGSQEEMYKGDISLIR